MVFLSLQGDRREAAPLMHQPDTHYVSRHKIFSCGGVEQQVARSHVPVPPPPPS